MNVKSEQVKGAGTDLLGFLRGTGTDLNSRSLEEILAWDDDRMEKVHDYIQWIFPTNEASRRHLGAPMLSPQMQRKARGDAQILDLLRQSFLRFCGFLGLELAGGPAAVAAGAPTAADDAAVAPPGAEDGAAAELAAAPAAVAVPAAMGLVVRKAANFESRIEVCWHTKVVGNHNWLRVSRVLHCLRLFGLDEEAAAFLQCLEGLYSEGFPVAPAIKHWRKRAAT